MFICEECGKTFEKPSTYVNGITNKSFQVCPHCGSVDYSGAVQCVICGDYISEMGNGVCEKCIDEAISGEIGKEYVFGDIGSNYAQIPRFLSFVYSNDEIKELLKKDFAKLVEDCQHKYISAFLKCEKEEFARYLEKKNNK